MKVIRDARKRSGRLELMPLFQRFSFRPLLKIYSKFIMTNGHFKQSLATIDFVFNRSSEKSLKDDMSFYRSDLSQALGTFNDFLKNAEMPEKSCVKYSSFRIPTTFYDDFA